jgi:hypothetical protein
MAELNFGLLTPPGSQSIGNAFVTGMDQAAAARQMENQNALSQYTLSKARREDEMQNQLYDAVRQPGFKLDIGTAMRFGAPGLAAYKAQEEGKKAAVDIAYTQAKTGAIPGTTAKTLAETTKLQDENRFRVIGEIASFPDAVSANQAIDARVASKAISSEDAERMRKDLTDENFTNWKRKTLTIILKPEEQLRQSAVTHTDTNRGGFVGRQYYDAQGKAVGPEERLDITVSPNTTATIKATRKNHIETLEQAGWSFDTDRGVAVNSRLGISKPISSLLPTVGGIPAVGGASAPSIASGGGVPGQRQTQVGQAPVGQPAPGVLGPKPEKPTESYLREAKGIANTNDALNNLKQRINNFTPSDMVDPSRRSEITQLSKTVALLSKEMFNLGVLNGGDLTILEQVIPNPVAFNQGLVPIETIKKNLNQATKIVNQMNKNLSVVHKQPLLSLDAGTDNAPSPSAPPIQSFRRP